LSADDGRWMSTGICRSNGRYLIRAPSSGRYFLWATWNKKNLIEIPPALLYTHLVFTFYFQFNPLCIIVGEKSCNRAASFNLSAAAFKAGNRTYPYRVLIYLVFSSRPGASFQNTGPAVVLCFVLPKTCLWANWYCVNPKQVLRSEFSKERSWKRVLESKFLKVSRWEPHWSSIWIKSTQGI
jgi:hypothetical protein